MGSSCFKQLVIKSCLSRKTAFKNPIFRLFLLWVLLLFAHQASVLADSEESVLLELKNSLSDRSGLLGSWNKTSGLTGSNHYCAWFGVTCNSNSRVVSLNITGNAGQGKENVFFCSHSAQFPFYGYGFRRNCVGSNGKLVGRLLASIAKLTELKILSFPFNGLFGELPVEIWGMEKLEVIDLEGNSLSGSLPVRFSGLKGLRVLNLGFNDISGEIPNSLAGLSNLEILNLAGNSMNGSLPGYLGQIKGVYLSFNKFTGSISGEIGKNCSKLEHLDISSNFLGGQIPRSIGGCGRLRSLLLYSNILEEVIPSEIGTLKNLEVLDISRNILSGSIPVGLGNCTSLSVLVLSNAFDPVHDMNSTIPAFMPKTLSSMNDDSNFYQGGIPEEITKLPNLRILWAPRANLEGKIPVNWATCEKLEMVNLAHNFLSGGVPHQLSQCKQLHFLDLSANKLSGELFQGISVPCMTLFDVSGNSLSGSIPTFLNNGCLLSSSSLQTFSLTAAYMTLIAYRAQVGFSLPFFEVDASAIAVHNFGQNNFNGSLKELSVPLQLVGKQTVYAFLAGNNNLSGPFPENFLGSCDGLGALVVNISSNRISGPFPSSLGTSCRSLVYLDAYGNQIAGSFSPSFGNSISLAALNLGWNLLQGQIPNSIGLLSNLKYFSVAHNNLSGRIPPSLVKLRSLQVLDLSSNSLSGEIPNDLGKLKNLSVLLLNNNRLSGQLPLDLANATTLTAFNVSVNSLSGPLLSNTILMKCPNVLGNHFNQSCQTVSLAVASTDMQKGGDSQNSVAAGPKSGASSGNGGFNSIEIASIACASAIVSVLVALIILFVYTRKCKPRSVGSVRKELTVFKDIGIPLTFENVVRATGGFNASNCIGSGGFGATYKAEISPGVLIAIKRLAVGRFQQGVQQFHAEIRTLGRLRHPHLVTLIGYHASETEMFLIYNYLPGGNLEKFIHERSTRAADWRVLHKIAFDIARALAYLHEQCVPRVLHRDVKPSNILLDEDYNAYLSDFGLARLLGTSETHATTGVAGTFGYVAPEYAMTCRVSDKADVYSYGVVLLELLSDKKALDPSFSSYGNGFNIVAWACMLLRQGRAKEFFTAGLWDIGPHDDLVEVLHLAVVCTVDSLSTRPTMKHVVHRLKHLQPPSC